MKKKIYVVMGNDFPDAAFSTEEKADAYVERMRKEDDKNNSIKIHHVKIYWRAYEFILDEKEGR